MAQSPEMIIKIGANTKEFNQAIDGLPKTAKKGLTALKVGAAAAAAAFALLAIETGKAVEEFRNFEREFSNVVTLLDEGSFKTKSFADGVDDMRKGLVNLRATSGQSFDTLNKGLFDLVSAGVDAEQAVEALAVATDLALAGGTDASIAVDGLTTAMNAFGFEADKAQQISEKFFTAQKFGKTTIEELSTGLGQVAATAAGMGVTFDEVLASVSGVTLAGVRTSEAYTGLKAVFSNIIKPSKDAADEAERLGINFDSTALRAKGLAGFLDSITESADFNSTSLEKLFGSMEAVNVVMALTGKQAEDFDKILMELNNEQKSSATFADALAVKNDTLDQQYKRLEGSASALRAEIGERLSPAFGNFAETAADALDFVRLNLDDLTNAVTGLADKLARLSLTTTELVADLAGIDITPPQLTRNDPFLGLIESAREYSKIGGQSISEILDAQEAAAAEEKRLADERKERLDKAAEEDVIRAQMKAEEEEKLRQEKAERDAELEEARIEREEEKFEADLERLNEHLSNVNELESEFSGLRELRDLSELKTKARTAKQKEAIDKATAQATIRASDLSTQASIENLQEVFGQESAIGKAIFLIRKAQAIANTITSTQEAMALARATVPPPGGDALAAKYAIQGALNVAVIGATAIQGAQEGGIVQGGSFDRDTQPFLLARDEIVVPSRLNPLSPNFDESFEGGGVGGNVGIEVSFDGDEAARFLTLKQREDEALGTQR